MLLFSYCCWILSSYRVHYRCLIFLFHLCVLLFWKILVSLFFWSIPIYIRWRSIILVCFFTLFLLVDYVFLVTLIFSLSSCRFSLCCLFNFDFFIVISRSILSYIHVRLSSLVTRLSLLYCRFCELFFDFLILSRVCIYRHVDFVWIVETCFLFVLN